MSVFLQLAVLEGRRVRNHRLMPDGRLRDTLVSSILASGRPVVRHPFTFKLQQDYSS
jgi:hypothetical protein